MKIDIFLFWFMDDWGLYGRAYEKIAENLAKIPEVGRVICSFPPDRAPATGHMFQIKEHAEKLLLIDLKQSVLKPAGRPYRFRQFVNRTALKLSLRLIVKKLGLKKENTMLWLYPPHAHIDNILAGIPHDFIVTQLVDNNSLIEEAGDSYRTQTADQYMELAKLSNVVITSSRTNCDTYSKLNPNCAMFENAVDSAFISEPSLLPCRIHPEKRVTLGYVGFISERTDLALMEFVAKSRPFYELHIAGPAVSGINLNENGLLDLPNVHYLGGKPYGEVPGFMQSMDVCLIPHKITPYSKSMSPLKLFQYLGSGRPIVSTAVSGSERFGNIISIANSHEEFLDLIDRNIADDTLELSSKRIDVARNEVWELRVRDIFNFVYDKYQAHSSRAH